MMRWPWIGGDMLSAFPEATVVLFSESDGRYRTVRESDGRRQTLEVTYLERFPLSDEQHLTF